MGRQRGRRARPAPCCARVSRRQAGAPAPGCSTTALGLHETRLNGAKVGADVLAPGLDRLQQARCSTRCSTSPAQIRQGDNALGAWLGNGWYSGSRSASPATSATAPSRGTRPQLVVELHRRHHARRSRTDSTWRTAPARSAPTTSTTARPTTPGWPWPAGTSPASTTRPGRRRRADRRQARPGVRRWTPASPCSRSCRPVAVTQPQAGRLGVRPRAELQPAGTGCGSRGPAGTTVTMRHAEVLNPDGTLYTANLRAAQATDRFTLAGTGARRGLRAAVHRARLPVRRADRLPAARRPRTRSPACAAWTDRRAAGHAHHLQRAGQPVAAQHPLGRSGPTCCPSRPTARSATSGSAGPATSPSSPRTSTFNLDVHGFLDKFTDDLADAQRADGAFTDVAPAVLLRRGHGRLGRRGRDRAVHAVAALRRPARRRRALRRDGPLGRLPARHRRAPT